MYEEEYFKLLKFIFVFLKIKYIRERILNFNYFPINPSEINWKNVKLKNCQYSIFEDRIIKSKKSSIVDRKYNSWWIQIYFPSSDRKCKSISTLDMKLVIYIYILYERNPFLTCQCACKCILTSLRRTYNYYHLRFIQHTA